MDSGQNESRTVSTLYLSERFAGLLAEGRTVQLFGETSSPP
ncbi:uncharacterized protein VDAG_05202 [Verticillium dahliae VdLs.17]|uniref:Uncharacterized protein n=1 Tax=Verticillium dahliae (strain VdLs.17 / ATCC MYA-4575 / FGSC 10137) TaxID=498257 RepID=G2X4X0_VERDV|nr:uncharacterized protein VDAG_05202 [Verticillium dahliae VdLs.17]EGY23764.1 hypothetical protein VDAG_05202 [Verticillium dahliae VdLs.17]